MATDDDEYELKSIKVLIESELSRIKIESESSRSNHPMQSICKVPCALRDLHPGAYTPRVISIGPLHKEDERLKAMEELKVTYMCRLFGRTVESTNKDMKKTSRTVESTNKYMKKTSRKCVKAALGLIGRARACYAPSLTNYGDSKLADMMVIDGCFILELLYRSELRIWEGDSISDNDLMKHSVKYDLLLLENQIPFFILGTLFNLTVKRILKSISLTDLIFDFFKDMNILNTSEQTFKYMNMLNNIEHGTVEHCHILGLLQSCYRPIGTEHGGFPDSRYSATEIAGAGVTFKPQTLPYSLFAVKFQQSPLVPGFGKLFVRKTSFRIPVLCIEYSTPSFMLNLIAYEQCCTFSHHYVTSLAFLMDMLIDTKDDVSLLVRSKVLQHKLGASEDVTKLFNSICNGVVRREFYYTAEWAKLDAYCKRFWPSILISLRNLYISTTWKTLTVIAAAVIFTLTLTQTIFSALKH